MTILLPEWPDKPTRNPPPDATVAFPDLADGVPAGNDQPPRQPVKQYPQPPFYSDTVFSEEMKSDDFYTEYEIVTQLEFLTGLKGAPIAAPKDHGRTAIWRGNGGFSKLTVSWMAERLGKWPIMPHWEIDTTNLFVLEGGKIIPESPVPTPMGQDFIYRVHGVYIYLLQVPVMSGFYFPVGATRFHKINAAAFALGANWFSKEPLAFISSITPPKIDY